MPSLLTMFSHYSPFPLPLFVSPFYLPHRHHAFENIIWHYSAARLIVCVCMLQTSEARSSFSILDT